MTLHSFVRGTDKKLYAAFNLQGSWKFAERCLILMLIYVFLASFPNAYSLQGVATAGLNTSGGSAAGSHLEG